MKIGLSEYFGKRFTHFQRRLGSIRLLRNNNKEEFRGLTGNKLRSCGATVEIRKSQRMHLLMSSANIIHCLSIRFEWPTKLCQDTGVTSTTEYYVMDMVYYF